MSRVSLNRRLDRIRDALLPPGSLAWRIDRLSPDLKQAHQLWQERVNRIFSDAEKRCPGGLYASLIDGANVLPPMPAAVAAALWPGGQSVHRITVDMSMEDAADVYRQFFEEGEAA